MTLSCDNACTAGHVRSPPTSGVVLQQQYGGNPASPEPSGGCRRGCGPAGRPRGDKRRDVTLSHPVCAAFLEQSLAGFAGAGIRVALRRCGRDGSTSPGHREPTCCPNWVPAGAFDPRRGHGHLVAPLAGASRPGSAGPETPVVPGEATPAPAAGRRRVAAVSEPVRSGLELAWGSERGETGVLVSCCCFSHCCVCASSGLSAARAYTRERPRTLSRRPADLAASRRCAVCPSEPEAFPGFPSPCRRSPLPRAVLAPPRACFMWASSEPCSSHPCLRVTVRGSNTCGHRNEPVLQPHPKHSGAFVGG